MMKLVLITTAFTCLFSLDIVDGRRCKEGINITLFELPFYHWSERECTGDSRCFSQEIGVSDIPAVTLRYGGCISAAYSKLFSCEKLFGNDSDLDPSVLLNLAADADDWIDKMSREIKENVTKEIKLLFSKGKGIEEFLEGGLLLYEMMGFNMEKARTLKKPLVTFLEASLDIDNRDYLSRFNEARLRLEQSLDELDTDEPKISGETYKFLGNFLLDREIEMLKKRANSKFIIEKLPGLYKSMLSKYNVSQWVDIAFEILGEIDLNHIENSAIKVAQTLRPALKISEKSRKYLDPFFDAIPKFYQEKPYRKPEVQLDIEFVVLILRGFGVNNTVATSLSDAIVRCVSSIGSGGNQRSVHDLIRSLPGLFYRFFPAEKNEIDRAFTAVTNGLQTFNLQNVASSRPLEKTTLSDFILSLIDNVRPDLYSRTPGLRMKYRRIIINLSRTFYNAMPAKYTNELDIFFRTLDSGFAAFPAVDSGRIITQLVTNLGGEVPDDVEPFLSSMQNIINSLVDESGPKLYKSLMKMILDYKKAFPDSKFPDIGRRYLEHINNTVSAQLGGHSCWKFLVDDTSNELGFGDKNYSDCVERYHITRKLRFLKLNKAINSIETDLFYAVFEAAGFDSDEKIRSISATNKPLATYLQLFRVIDPEDVKELLSDYSAWFINLFDEGDNYKFDNFLYAINVTTAKITSKIGKFMKQLRHVHAPRYCKYLTCDEEICNKHEALDSVSPISQGELRGEIMATTSTTTAPSTTSGSAIITQSIVTNIAISTYLMKIFV